jgi:hypothetical protein
MEDYMSFKKTLMFISLASSSLLFCGQPSGRPRNWMDIISDSFCETAERIREAERKRKIQEQLLTFLTQGTQQVQTQANSALIAKAREEAAANHSNSSRCDAHTHAASTTAHTTNTTATSQAIQVQSQQSTGGTSSAIGATQALAASISSQTTNTIAATQTKQTKSHHSKALKTAKPVWLRFRK